MGNLASTAVAINRSWTEGGINGRDLSCRDVSLTLTGQGGLDNKILASVLGLTSLEQCGNFVDDADGLIPAAVSNDRSMLLLYNMAEATDGARAVPADFNATVIRGVVKGYL